MPGLLRTAEKKRPRHSLDFKEAKMVVVIPSSSVLFLYYTVWEINMQVI